MSEIPPDLYYTAEHEWVQRVGDDTVRVGITDFAQSSLGDVVFVQLPDVGTDVTAGESFGEVESTKSVSDLYSPVTARKSLRSTVIWRAARSWSTPTPTAKGGSSSCRSTARRWRTSSADCWMPTPTRRCDRMRCC